MTKRQMAAAFRQAAKDIEEYRYLYVCHALGSELSEIFADIYKEDAIAYGRLHEPVFYCRNAWMANATLGEDGDFDPQNVRVTALCFAAAMAETGDLL